MLRYASNAMHDAGQARFRRSCDCTLQLVGKREHHFIVSADLRRRPEAERYFGNGCIGGTGREFARSLESGLRLRRNESPPLKQRLSVTHLQIDALPVRCKCCLDRFILRQRLEQRLRLRDLREFRRRRKACQRRPQNVVGVDRTAGGLIELGQRQRSVQLEAAGLLLLGDGDGGEEGGFGGRGVGWIGLQQDVASDTVQKPVGPVFPRLLRDRPILPRSAPLACPKSRLRQRVRPVRREINGK